MLLPICLEEHLVKIKDWLDKIVTKTSMLGTNSSTKNNKRTCKRLTDSYIFAKCNSIKLESKIKTSGMLLSMNSLSVKRTITRSKKMSSIYLAKKRLSSTKKFASPILPTRFSKSSVKWMVSRIGTSKSPLIPWRTTLQCSKLVKVKVNLAHSFSSLTIESSSSRLCIRKSWKSWWKS